MPISQFLDSSSKNLFPILSCFKVGTNPIVDKYNKSIAQVALRYLIQIGVSVLPKSVSKERMIQDIDVFDFELTKEDMDLIAALDNAESLFFSHYDPQTVEYLTGISR